MFREFVAEFGGCAFEERVWFPLPESCPWQEGGRGLFDLLYGSFEDGTYDLIREHSLLQGRLPEGFVPFGQDPGGNELCLSVLPDGGEGGVFYWNITGGDYDRALHVVAESLEEFLSSLEGEAL